jgi:hypothetical protein
MMVRYGREKQVSEEVEEEEKKGNENEPASSR